MTNDEPTTSAATIAPRKRRKEGTTTNDEDGATTACGGNAPPLQAPTAYPNPNLKISTAIEPARSAIESLPFETQDHIVEHIYAIYRLYLDLQKKETRMSKIQSGEPKKPYTLDENFGTTATDNDLTHHLVSGQ